MSDFEHSSVTYTSVPSPVEDYSDIGSPEVDRPPSPNYVPGSEELEQAPLSPDYVPGPKEPEQAPPSPVYLPYVLELVYPEYMPPEDDGDPEEDDKEDPEEDPADYPADSTVVALTAVDHVPSEERLRFASPTPSQEVRESSIAVREELYGFVDRVDVTPGRPMSRELDYDITNSWDELVGAIEEIAPTTLQGGYACLSPFSSYDREREAKMAREAWGLSMDASNNARSDVMSLRTTKLTKALRLLKGLQTQMIEFQRHHGPAKDPAYPDAPGEAGSSS
nr:hypothetical protein [Tanacetum cinerariifolium]